MQEEMKHDETDKNPIEEAKELLAEIKAENLKAEELLRRKERLMAESMLGGKSEAGSIPVLPKEESAKEYADRIMRGGK